MLQLYSVKLFLFFVVTTVIYFFTCKNLEEEAKCFISWGVIVDKGSSSFEEAMRVKLESEEMQQRYHNV